MRLTVTVILLMVPLISLTSAQNLTVSFLCTEEYCQEEIDQNSCEELPKECGNSSAVMNGIMMLEPSVCNCCDYCLTYLEEGEACVLNGQGQPLHEALCGPGLSCQKLAGEESATCAPLDSDCTREQRDYDQARENGTLGFTRVRPLCSEKGDYLPAHCIGGSICYCVNPQGERIFGEQMYSNYSLQETMTCECSLAAWKVEQLATEMDIYTPPIHCFENGSYDQLQCNEGTCRCLESLTNMPVEDIGILEMNILEGNPECFDPEIHTKGKYVRECEEEAINMMERRQNLLDEDIIPMGLRLPSCQYDGRYSRVMITDTQKSCVDPDGNELGYVVKRSDPLADTMDCNCARTIWLMKREGKTELPTCCSNGNFKSQQCRRGQCFCVDCNGNQKGIEVDETEKDILPCSDYCSTCEKSKRKVERDSFVIDWEPLDI